MISLRRAIEKNQGEMLRTALAAYRNAIVGVSDAGARVFPQGAESFQTSLNALSAHLTEDADANVVEETTGRVLAELNSWSATVAEHFRQHTTAVREVLLLVASATSEVGSRDQRYATHFGDLAQRLRATSELPDLASMRTSLRKSATELTITINQMVREAESSLATLQAQLSVYESRVQEIEQLAFLDTVTGVANRRACETELEKRVQEHQPFSVILLDLDGFKVLNDTYGHEAGDLVLREFASRLKKGCRGRDMVGRWGGDEFLVIVDGTPSDAAICCSRLQLQMNGIYSLKTSDAKVVAMRASAGVASWHSGDTLADMLRRADEAMYTDKERNGRRR